MKNRPLKILIVAMSDSIHTATWISQISDQGWGLHLFPSYDIGATHPELGRVTIYQSIYGRPNPRKDLQVKGLPVYSDKLAGVLRDLLLRFSPNYRLNQLKHLIYRLKPDIIHSMELQGAGYLTLKARKNWRGQFPTWIATIWGSDIYLFGQLREHQTKVKQILEYCDYFSCECQRDVYLAQKLGLKGQVLRVGPVSAGSDLTKISRWRKKPSSARKLIMLKGYQTAFGRALVGLRALERCAKWLEGYKIVIYLVEKDSPMHLAAELFTRATGISTEVISRVSHEEILKLHGQARISLGLGISDGISVSFLEALTMGSFPIQSNTSCSDEWAKNGQNAFFVPPNDPDKVAIAIRKALSDDNLVDQAARLNWQTAKDKLEYNYLKKECLKMYKKALRPEQTKVINCRRCQVVRGKEKNVI